MDVSATLSVWTLLAYSVIVSLNSSNVHEGEDSFTNQIIEGLKPSGLPGRILCVPSPRRWALLPCLEASLLSCFDVTFPSSAPYRSSSHQAVMIGY